VVTGATVLPPDGLATARQAAAVVGGTVLLVLLIACANVANLLLAIAVGRRQEASIKLALGASRGRIIGEFLKESAVICAASGALGYAAASWLITRYSSVTVPLPLVGPYSFSTNLHVGGAVITLTVGLIVIALLATGLAPAFYASSPHLAQVLSGEITVGGRHKNVRRNVLVIVQVAMCTLVLVGMGLCQRSLYNLRHVDPGFSARNLISLSAYPLNDGSTPERNKEAFGELRRQASELPGVESAALTSNLPLLGGDQETLLLPDGKSASVSRAFVDADYFTTLGIPILAGRGFNSGDREKSPEVVVVNRQMAETYWPGQDPLNKTITVGAPPRKATVVGVVPTGKYEDLDEDPRSFFYYAMGQHNLRSVDLVARTKSNPNLWREPLQKLVHGANLFTLDPMTFENWMNLSLFGERFSAGIFAGLSTLGLVLAAIGLFGAVSYSVSERKKELGIRVALGAGRMHLLKMILRQTLVVGGAGVLLGILLGVAATILLRSEFYHVVSLEWTVLAPVGAGMLGVSLLVAYFSARPWIKVDPMEAVRHA
jgi:predicted permease